LDRCDTQTKIVKVGTVNEGADSALGADHPEHLLQCSRVERRVALQVAVLVSPRKVDHHLVYGGGRKGDAAVVGYGRGQLVRKGDNPRRRRTVIARLVS
jgi:hypothetical protein